MNISIRSTTSIVAVALAFTLFVSCSKAPDTNQAEQSTSSSTETTPSKEEQSDESESASTETSDSESDSSTSSENESASSETGESESESSTSSERESDSSKTSSSNASGLPEFNASTVDGNDLSHQDLLGNVTVINYWGTWCPPCVEEIPHFQQTYENLNKEGFTMLGIAIPQGGRGTVDDVQSFMKEHEMTYPVVMYDSIPMDQFQEKFGRVKGLPTTLVLDRNGQLQNSFIGYTSKEKLNNAIDPLLDE